MKKSMAWATPVTVISVTALAGLALDRDISVISQAQATDVKTASSEVLCPRGDATLHGTYMSRGGGTVVGVGPVAFIGTGYFDGKGGMINPFTVSLAGTISRVVGKGTYTVNNDCSATLTMADDTHYDMRVSPDGSRIDYIETDAGTIVSGSASRVND